MKIKLRLRFSGIKVIKGNPKITVKRVIDGVRKPIEITASKIRFDDSYMGNRVISIEITGTQEEIWNHLTGAVA